MAGTPTLSIVDAPDTVTKRLELLPLWPGTRALDAAPALARALAGEAALLPVPANDPARAELLATSQRAGEPIDGDVALVACTSGSTGTPKGAMLTPANLRASIDATHARLGGPGQWLLATPPEHIAGLQVLLRTIRAGEEPAAMDLADGFRPAAFADAIGRMTGARRYSSIVPLQLGRVLADPGATAAAASLDAVLVGGQATEPGLLRRAREAGITVVTSYGSSETSGGVVYDGMALDGVDVTIVADGRIVLTGPMVSRGYRNVDHPDLADGVFRTSDAGSLDADGTLSVLGRVDDIIISGGLKFLPGPIESVLAAHPAVAAAAVVAVPDPDLGQAVAAAVVLADGHSPDPAVIERELRDHCAGNLTKHETPRILAVVKHLPTMPSGKLDRSGLTRALADRSGTMPQ